MVEPIARRLLDAEEELNAIEILGAPVGSLLTRLFESVNRQRLEEISRARYRLSRFKRLMDSLMVRTIPDYHLKGKILLSKITDKPQCNALIDPLFAEFEDQAVYFNGDNGSLNHEEVRNLLATSEVIMIRKEVARHMKSIMSVLQSKKLNISPFTVKQHIEIQLGRYWCWMNVFKKGIPQLVVVDFDRDNRNSTLVLAARKNGVKTITLVHGVLNPPYGYWPIIADEIWCWSRFQKKQLIEHNVDESRIKVVGSPVVREFEKSREKEVSSLKIGIGLSPVEQEFNIKLLSELTGMDIPGDMEFIVKLHPSMKEETWMEQFKSSTVTIVEDHVMNLPSFFNAVDLLIIGLSGIGYEAILNNVPIWVYKSHPDSVSHDMVMIEYGHCPDISSSERYHKELNELISDPQYLQNLLLKERTFVLEEFYFKTGDEASRYIGKLIKEEIKDVE